MYTLQSDLRQVPDYSPVDFDRFLSKCPGAGLGASFINAGTKHGINPLFLMSLGIVESGWFRSRFSVERNNPFGYMAYDSNPDLAARFSSMDAAIDFIACFLKNSYLTAPNGQTYQLPNGQYGRVGQWYGGEPTPHGVFVRYSSSHDREAETVVQLMNQFLGTLAVGGPVMEPVSQPLPEAAHVDTYTVVRGDTLWKIAERTYGSGSRYMDIATANSLPNPNFIRVGQVLKLPGKRTIQSPAPSVSGLRTYQVEGEDGAWGLYGISRKVYSNPNRWPDIAKANHLTAPYIIHVGQVLTIPE